MLSRFSRSQRRLFSRSIGFASNSSQLFGMLTVQENLEYMCRLYGFSLFERRKRIAYALDLCDLSDRASDRVWTLSTGLKQRANIARAIISNPRLLFLDEPTSGLDPVAVRAVYDIFEALRASGITVVLTTHIMQEVDDLCDRVLFLDDGHIIADGSPADLRRICGNVVYNLRVSQSMAVRIDSSLNAMFGIKLPHDSHTSHIRVVAIPHFSGLIDLTVFGDVPSTVFDEFGVNYTRRSTQLRDVFLYLKRASADTDVSIEDFANV